MGISWLDVKLCDCAGCRRPLLSPAQHADKSLWPCTDAGKHRIPPPVAGREDGRPYCATCHAYVRPDLYPEPEEDDEPDILILNDGWEEVDLGKVMGG